MEWAPFIGLVIVLFTIEPNCGAVSSLTLAGRPTGMSGQQRAYCRKFLERAPLGLSSLEPFLLLGETGPCLCFGEHDVFQPG